MTVEEMRQKLANAPDGELDMLVLLNELGEDPEVWRAVDAHVAQRGPSAGVWRGPTGDAHRESPSGSPAATVREVNGKYLWSTLKGPLAAAGLGVEEGEFEARIAADRMLRFAGWRLAQVPRCP